MWKSKKKKKILNFLKITLNSECLSWTSYHEVISYNCNWVLTLKSGGKTEQLFTHNSEEIQTMETSFM